MTGCVYVYILLSALLHKRPQCYIALPLASFHIIHMHLCRILSVVLYLMFLFMVVIVLLNTLIAQVSDTYTKVLKTAEDVHLFYQCAYIAKLEKQKIHFVNSSLKMLLAKCLACLKWLGCNCPCFVSVSLFNAMSCIVLLGCLSCLYCFHF